MLPVTMGILGSVMVVALTTSMHSATTNRYLDSVRARRLMSVVSRSVASEASSLLEEKCGPMVATGRMKERSKKLHQDGQPRVVEVPMTQKLFAAQRVRISPVSAVFSPLKRHWDRNRDKNPAGGNEQPEEEFPRGDGAPPVPSGSPEEEPPKDEDVDKEEEAWKPPKEGDELQVDEGEEREEGEDGGGGNAGKEKSPGLEKDGKGNWRKRGARGLVQLKFDVSVETLRQPLKRRISIRRCVVLRKWGWHPLRVDGQDVARSQEAIP